MCIINLCQDCLCGILFQGDCFGWVGGYKMESLGIRHALMNLHHVPCLTTLHYLECFINLHYILLCLINLHYIMPCLMFDGHLSVDCFCWILFERRKFQPECTQEGNSKILLEIEIKPKHDFGFNQTKFNVHKQEEFYQGIRSVWCLFQGHILYVYRRFLSIRYIWAPVYLWPCRLWLCLQTN